MFNSTFRRNMLSKEDPIVFFRLCGFRPRMTADFWNRAESLTSHYGMKNTNGGSVGFDIGFNRSFIDDIGKNRELLNSPFYSYPCGGGVHTLVSRDILDSLNSEEHADV